MEAIDQTTIAIDLLTPLVEGTRPEQLGGPTPCEAWTVGDLIGHFVMGGHMFAASLRGAEISGEPPADVLGDDHVAAYLAAIADFQDAVSHLDSLEKPAQLPFGTVPADIALRIAAGDLLVHGWDLSQATGQGFEPPEDVVGEIEGFYRVAIGPELRAGGSFGEPVRSPRTRRRSSGWSRSPVASPDERPRATVPAAAASGREGRVEPAEEEVGPVGHVVAPHDLSYRGHAGAGLDRVHGGGLEHRPLHRLAVVGVHQQGVGQLVRRARRTRRARAPRRRRPVTPRTPWPRGSSRPASGVTSMTSPTW